MTVLSADKSRDSSASGTFDSLSPTTGERLASYPVASEAEVAAAVSRARTAFWWWGSLSYAERRTHLSAWRRLIARRVEEFADLVSAENGKRRADAVLEILLTLDHLAWATKHAEKVLGPQRVSPGALAANHAATVEYPPLGVVGVIGPWNYPVFTPMGSIGYALSAGN